MADKKDDDLSGVAMFFVFVLILFSCSGYHGFEQLGWPGPLGTIVGFCIALIIFKHFFK
jgi:hypothetical protein